MSSFLISFCNNKKNKKIGTNEGLLGLLNISGRNIEFTSLSINLENFEVLNGATGLAKCHEFYYVIGQSSFSRLIVLDQAFKVVLNISLEPLKGVHSVLYHEGYLYLVATKQDKVVKYYIKSGIQSGIEKGYEVVYSLDTESDTNHFNSICIHKKDLIMSAFGDKEKEFWMYADNGYLYNITKDKKIMSGLKQPHSLFSNNSSLFVCDSSRKRIINGDGETFVQNETGYTRGLFINESMIIFGISKGRVISHSQNKYVGNISDKGILSGFCSINVVIKDDLKSIQLENIAEEIYDIMEI